MVNHSTQGSSTAASLRTKITAMLAPLWMAMRFVWDSGPKLTLLRLVVMVIQGVLPLGTLYLTKLIVDAIALGLTDGPVADPGPLLFSRVVWLLVWYGVFTIATSVVESFAEFISIAQHQRITDFTQITLHAKANALDLAYYENPTYHDMLERAEEEAAYRPTEVLESLFRLGLNSISLLGITGLLLSLHWGLAIVLLVAAIPAALVRIKYTRVLYRWTRDHTPLERQSEYFSWLLTSDTAAQEMRLFNIGGFFQQRFKTLRHHLYRGRLAIARQRFMVFSLTQIIIGFITLTSYGYVISQTLKGGWLIGDLVLYHQAFQRGQDALRSFLRSISDLYEGSLFIENIREFLNLDSTLKSPDQPQLFPVPIQAGIHCRDVSFRYPNSDRQALHDINLTVAPGEVVALVGENGSGKTTLVKLLCRLYDPMGGAIEVDGIDLRQFAIEELRQQISVVFQDYTKYHLTAQENIWLGNIDQAPTIASIQLAAFRAGAHDAIKTLPRGYDTMLGKWFDQGEELSIGQWQAIALARAFLRPSQLIMLDEPTSALDPNTEYRVFQKFRQLIQNQSAILITHRLSTVKLADRIYVMQNGTIVEQGAHHELLRRQGLYTSLYNTQANQYKYRVKG